MWRLENNGVPFYLQIVGRLRELAGDMETGERLPSEPQLARRFNVSRFTIAKAIEQLAREGLVVRRQGRGTFVSSAPLRRQPGHLLSFTEAVEATGHRASHKLLAYQPVSWQPGFPYDEEEELLLLDRLRFIDQAPVARHRSVLSLPLATAIGLTREKVAAEDFSLYRYFESCGLTLATAYERLVARLANDEEQKLLFLTGRAAVISVWRETRSDDGRPLDAVSATYDARRYSYDARLLRRAWNDTGIEGLKIKREDKNVVQNHHYADVDPGTFLEF